MAKKEGDGFEQIFEQLMGTMGRQMLTKGLRKPGMVPDEIRTSSFSMTFRLDDSGISLDVTEVVREERFTRKR